MHVALDLNWFLHFLVLALAAAFGFLYLVRNTASRYLAVDSNFASTAPDFASDRNGRAVSMAPAAGEKEVSDACAVCGLSTKKQCARCKMVKYCSEACQRSHWISEHKTKCKELQSVNKANHTKLTSVLKDRKPSLVLASGSSKTFKKSNAILFPYKEFVKFFNWEKPDYPPPCGLLNCGNSCFANVVLQCLAYTRPLVAYMLEKGHKTQCQMEKWCFFCEFQTHVERATRSTTPFSPMNILSRLPNIGGNLGYGQQEDAHEFMRVAIDSMQSACLGEFGGEKAVHPNYQQTTLIQHIFGGRLQSQVICIECNNVSSQFENMMDLTVEIHGDAEILEECLDQFTAKEQLHGDNKYKCDGCNAYVTAWKCLSIQQAPNILTIALKRFQSGRFGKLNKRVTFPEWLNLGPYMSELEDGNDYMLYAVIVHVDMLNASFFGHYINYVKDFRGNWYRIDDCEVARVDLDEVLSQVAYMLLYRRIHARPLCLLPVKSLKEQENENVKTQAVDPPAKQPVESSSASATGALDNPVANCSEASVNMEEPAITNPEPSLPIMNGEIPSIEVVPKPTSSADNAVELIPVSTSLVDSQSIELDANDVAPETGNANEGLQRITSQESTVSDNHSKIEEGKVSSNVSSVNGNSNVENSSRTKLKPVFAPGFLGKQDFKQKSKVPVEAKKTTKNIPKNMADIDGEKNPSLVLQNGRTSKSLKNGDSEPSTCTHCKYPNSNNKRNDGGSSRAAKPCC